jgi:hypothetical protein
MDELQRLVILYSTRERASVNSKLDVLMDLERVRDPRVVPFLVQIVMDPREGTDVRIHLMKQLRSGSGILVPADRPVVASALGDVLTKSTSEEIRLQAALALGDFASIDGVLSLLTVLSLVRDESLDLRYAAFTSIERAGATPEAVAALRRIAVDETLGDAARSVLLAWHVS